MLAHVKRIPTLLSVYDALQMSRELRKSLIEVLSNPEDYQDNMGLPDRVVCLATISFTDEEKYAEIDGHNRPIYISGIFANKLLSRVMVDNGSAVNIISLRTLLSVGLTVDHLKT